MTIASTADAEANLETARRELIAARKAFEDRPHDLSREGVVKAEVAYEDAVAIASEWIVDAQPGAARVVRVDRAARLRRMRGE